MSAPELPDEREARAELGAGRERRLHPLSWLFVLLAQLKEFAIPLIALFVFGRGSDTWEFVGLIGAGVLALSAVVRYFTYRFRIAGDELVIRSGILQRNVRHIPLARIQNVALRRNLLHRLFGVAEVRLESAASGATAEAQMRVLSLADAAALEALVRASAGGATPGAQAEPEGDLLLALPLPELVKLGLTSNRGLLVGAAGLGAFSQFSSGGFGRLVGNTVEALFGYARDLHLPWWQWSAAVVLLAATFVLILRAFSVLLTVLQFHDFKLWQLDQRLRVEGGLLTRLRSNAPRRKIQHWTLRESLIHRWFGRRSLRVETAVLQTANETQALSAIVPIAPPATIDALITRWLPAIGWPDLPWRPLHPRAWRRLLVWPVLATAVATPVLVWRFGAVGLCALALLPWWWLRARRLAGACGWAVNERVLAWRSGWLDRRVSFAEIGKLQALQLVQSPFDRRHGMASVIADTAGASPAGHRLHLRYLPEAEARALFALLGPRIAHSRLRW